MIRTILVATDGSDHAKKTLGLANDLAAKYDAKLVLVHVLMANARSETLAGLASRRALGKRLWERLNSYELEVHEAMAGANAGGGFVTIPAPREVLEGVGRHILARVEAQAAKAGVKKISTVLAGGDAADAILDTAGTEKADMIVLGSRGLSDIKGLFLGSVSHKVAARSEGTCVTVK